MRVLLLVIALGWCSVVFSKDIHLVKITADTDMLPSYMYVVLGKDGDIVEFGKKDLDANGNVLKRESYPLRLDYSGVVLKKKKGRNIVIMRGHNIGPTYGGGLELDFLFNGITGSRKSFHMSLERSDLKKWKVMVGKKSIEHLHFKVHRKRFVGVVGVRKVQIVK